jgi:transcriptional regulator with XRE-family HTH domain
VALNENITRRRKAIGLSRKHVAELLGITERQWWRMETDRIAILACEMPRIARVLETTITHLYRGADEHAGFGARRKIKLASQAKRTAAKRAIGADGSARR